MDKAKTIHQAHPIKKSFVASNSAAARVTAQMDRIAPRLIVFRRQLHRHPDLSGAELATTAYLGQQLTAAKITHRVGKGKRGIITGVAPATNAAAPVVALRADIDALR